MPTYEYTCKKCGNTLEVFQSFSDKPLKVHEDCGGDLKKVFHARGIVFKGSGFYATDARPVTDKSTAPKEEKKKPEPAKTAPSGSTSGSKSDS